MNETTRTLLLKTRKGATSSFGPKQWKEVLEALGLQVVLTKERNSIVGFEVLSAAGGQLVAITKEPRYRCITFYRLVSDLKALGRDLVEMSSAALNMDTPDVERKLKDLYVRDLTNTGTCPVCEGNFKRNGTGLVHHGFTRPGDGMIHGDCFAVGYLPWELSPQGAIDYTACVLVPHLKGVEQYLANLVTNAVACFFDNDYEWQTLPNGSRSQVKVRVQVTQASDAERYERLKGVRIGEVERDIAWTKREIERQEKRIANWKPDELPEVKHAGKFKAA